MVSLTKMGTLSTIRTNRCVNTDEMLLSQLLVFPPQFYIDNTFGLKTLDEEKRIHFHVVPGVDHSSFPDSEKVFECCIKPYLN